MPEIQKSCAGEFICNEFPGFNYSASYNLHFDTKLNSKNKIEKHVLFEADKIADVADKLPDRWWRLEENDKSI